jgi:hypothetical protein
MNSASEANAEIFKTFIVHNYRDTMKYHWRDFVAMISQDKVSWTWSVASNQENTLA